MSGTTAIVPAGGAGGVVAASRLRRLPPGRIARSDRALGTPGILADPPLAHGRHTGSSRRSARHRCPETVGMDVLKREVTRSDPGTCTVYLGMDRRRATRLSQLVLMRLTESQTTTHKVPHGAAWC